MHVHIQTIEYTLFLFNINSILNGITCFYYDIIISSEKKLPHEGAEVIHLAQTWENEKGSAEAEAYFSNWNVCFVRLLQRCWARPCLIKVFCSTESQTGPEHAEAVLFLPSITSTVITFVYSGGNSSSLIRSYWGDNSQVIWKMA